MTTPALSRTTFAEAKRSIAAKVAAVLLAVGVTAGLAAAAPAASAATVPAGSVAALGHTHCFASTKDGPHVGCQLNHSVSEKFRGSFLRAGAAAAGTVCVAFVEFGPVVGLCVAAAAAIYYWVSSYAPTLGRRQCIEIGLGIDNAAPYKLDAGAGYIKRIPCSVELAARPPRGSF